MKEKEKDFSRFSLPISFFIAFTCWAWSFWPFLSGRLAFSADAIAYFSSMKYIIHQLAQGVFPLWNSLSLCYNGAPNALFLQRVGVYNPFYLLLIILTKMGFPFLHSYLAFLSGYYFLGMLGFYFLAKEVLESKCLAFLAFLLLMFSSLGTRLLDSYIHLQIVPQIWFYFFLISFIKKPKNTKMIAMTFCLMLILTTYIPFYFVVIFMTGLSCFSLVYTATLLEVGKKIFLYIRKNKGVVILCFVLIGLACLPGVQLFLEAQDADFVMPMRHVQVGDDNVLAINPLVGSVWAIVEEFVYASYFVDLRTMTCGVFYLPVTALILFGIGILTPVNRRTMFFLLWLLSLLLIGSPRETPVYWFLSNHLFIFKYFKNLHFFLWIGLLPIFILYVVDQLGKFFIQLTELKNFRFWMLVFVGLMHLAVALFAVHLGPVLFVTKLNIVFSAVFFSLCVMRKITLQNKILPLFLLLIVLPQPLQVYRNICANSVILKSSDGEKNYGKFKFVLDDSILTAPIQTTIDNTNLEKFPPIPGPKRMFYYGSKLYSELYEKIDPAILDYYANRMFKVYDKVKLIGTQQLPIAMLENNFYLNKNEALLFGVDAEGVLPDLGTKQGNEHSISPQAQDLSESSSALSVLSYDANNVIIQTDFAMRKFLVYNDSYYDGWQAILNGKKTPIWQANYAFKGVWLPKGKNILHFHYGKFYEYFTNFLLLAIFYVVFFGLLSMFVKDKIWYKQKYINCDSKSKWHENISRP